MYFTNKPVFYPHTFVLPTSQVFYQQAFVYPQAISHAELSFFAVSLNLCLCLKSSPITVEHVKHLAGREKNVKENQKDHLSSQININK